MPSYEVKSPDGDTYQITAPEGATEDDAMSYAKINFQKEPESDGFIDRISTRLEGRSME